MKRIVITGATSGIGLRLAETYAAKGWRVGMAGRRDGAMKELKELFPEPDTPVTQVMIPSGNFTVTFFRLFSFAPFTVSHPAGFLRSGGTGIFLRPLKYAPVMESGLSIISWAVPAAMTCPPCSPAPGPISTM